MRPNHLQSFHVLVVDNERLIQKLVHAVLTSLGFTHISVAENGQKAIDMIGEARFDFMITDWRMDDFDGIEIVRYVRAMTKSPNYNMPIIMLTGNTEASYVKEAIGAGVNGYLIKPFSAAQLTKRIRTLIEMPRDFVMSKVYKGPDRRHAVHAPPGGVERRKSRSKAQVRTRAGS